MASTENQPLVDNVKGIINSSGATDELSINEMELAQISKSAVNSEPSSQKGTTTDAKLTYLQGMMHYLKAYIVTGYLTLPFAIKQVGLWTGSVGLLVLSIITLINVMTMVECNQMIRKKFNRETMTYPEAMWACFAVGPIRLQKYATKARILANVFLFLLVFGCCAVYLSMLAAYSRQLLGRTNFPSIDIRAYLAVWTVLLVPVCCVKNLKFLAPFSFLGNFANVVALVIIFQYIFSDLPQITSRNSFTSFTGILLFISDSIYAFEGVGMIIALENRMKRPEEFSGMSGVVGIGTIIVIVLYIATAFFGFLKFGDKVQGSIILNLPTNQGLYMSLKILALLNLYVSFGVNIYLPTHLVWDPLETRLATETRFRKYGEYLVRCIILLIAFACTAAVPNVELIIPLIGSLCGSVITFVLPPLMRLLITLSPEYRDHYTKKKQVFMIIIFGLLFVTAIILLCVSVTMSMWQIIYYYAYGKSIPV